MTRGGKRKGAGRKPSPNKKVKKSITIRPDQLEWITSDGRTASKEIEIALDKHIKREQ